MNPSKQVKTPVADLLDATSDAMQLLRTYTDGDFTGSDPLALAQVESPTTFPTATEGTAGAITGTLYYLVSFITADGMTEVPRNIDGTTVLPTGITVTSKRVQLSDIPVGPSGVTGRQIWRGDNTGYNYRKLAVINDNTTTVYTDNEPFGLATDLEARWNSTGGYISVNGEARFIADPSLTAVGAGQSRTSNGENNSLFGYRAGASLEDGYWNSLFGSQCGESLTSGYENSYFGYRAGKETTTGWYNAGFGMGALESVTTGGTNSACGRSAGGLLTTGGANCFMGYGSGQRMTTSTNSIVIGENSANFLNDGTTSFTDADFGIYIGNGCRGYANDEQNAIVIGYLAKGLGSNTTVVGTINTGSARIYGSTEFRSGSGTMSAVNIDGSDSALGRIQLIAATDGTARVSVGVGGSTYDAMSFPTSDAGLTRFASHVSFANGNWQMSNEGRHRISFDADGTTRIRGHGAGETHVFSNGDGNPILTLNATFAVSTKPLKFPAGGANWWMSDDEKHRFYFDSNGTTRIRGHGSGETHVFSNGNGDPVMVLDSSATAGHTRFHLFDVDNGTLERVTVGAADSGGSGYKLLRIPN